MTAQRLAICEYLEDNDEHPTAADVYEALQVEFPTMSLATVYNTLSLLVELDLIHEIGATPDGSTRYDPHTAPHLNLLCTRCQRIVDINDIDLSELNRLSVARGFQVYDVNVTVHGLCPDCQRAVAEGELEQ